MKVADFLTESEFEKKRADPADRIHELKNIQKLSQFHLMRIFDKWQALAEKGLVTKTEPRKGGTWFRIPETMALSGKWYSALDWGTPEGQRLEKYFHTLAKREAEVIERGRLATAELEALEKELRQR